MSRSKPHGMSGEGARLSPRQKSTLQGQNSSVDRRESSSVGAEPLILGGKSLTFDGVSAVCGTEPLVVGGKSSVVDKNSLVVDILGATSSVNGVTLTDSAHHSSSAERTNLSSFTSTDKPRHGAVDSNVNNLRVNNIRSPRSSTRNRSSRRTTTSAAATATSAA